MQSLALVDPEGMTVRDRSGARRCGRRTQVDGIVRQGGRRSYMSASAARCMRTTGEGLSRYTLETVCIEGCHGHR